MPTSCTFCIIFGKELLIRPRIKNIRIFCHMPLNVFKKYKSFHLWLCLDFFSLFFAFKSFCSLHSRVTRGTLISCWDAIDANWKFISRQQRMTLRPCATRLGSHISHSVIGCSSSARSDAALRISFLILCSFRRAFFLFIYSSPLLFTDVDVKQSYYHLTVMSC